MSASGPYSRSPLIGILGLWLVVGALALIAWHAVGSTEPGRFLVSRPGLVLDYGRAHVPAIGRSLSWTLLESLVGLATAVIFGLGIGALAVFKPALTRFAHPLLVASQVIPFVCLAPLIVLVFGYGPGGKAFLSALMCFFPIVTSILAAIRHAPAPHLEMMRLMGASRSLVIRHVMMPFATPYFFAGLRVAAPFAVIGAIVAEFNGANWGIGKDLFISAKRLEPEMMMLGLLSGALASGVLYGLVLFAESFLGSWYKHFKHHEN